jgi:hypothetical protein
LSGDQLQARMQRIEDHVRSLDQKVSVLSAVDGEAAKKRVQDTFGTNPRMVIIYRGIQAGLTQQKIAEALRARNLPGAQRPRVSLAFTDLTELGFVEKTPKGPFVPIEGWNSFGLERVLRRTLRNQGIDDLS